MSCDYILLLAWVKLQRSMILFIIPLHLEISQSDGLDNMILINFSLPFKPMQIIQAESFLHEKIDRVIDFQLQFDSDLGISEQVLKILKKFPLSSEELKSDPVAVVLPKQNYMSALVLAFLFSKMGYYPFILRTRMASMGILPFHEVVEVINPHEIIDFLE
jgi:hypothetical protein